MQQSNFSKFEKLQILLRNLWDDKSKSNRLIIALNLANEVIRIFGIPDNELEEPEEILNKAFSNARFKNQKMETWFEKHPFFGSGRIALQHYDKGTYPVETKFYQLNESFSKARISATTQIEPNWEDNELTMLPDYKVGVDFFLDSNAKSLSIVLTNQGNLRVMELSERLTNTQIEIFNKLRNTFRLDGVEGKSKEEIKFEPQRTIHLTLWSAFELKEVNKRFYEGVSDLFELLSSHLEKQENLKKAISDLSKQSKQFANRLIGRILFLWFLNKKGILSNKFNYFEINTDSTDYYNKKLKILFYDVLNTSIDERKNTKDLETPYLNGGLFEPHFNDWNNLEFKFPDNWFNDFYKHLNEFNFTTDESSPDYEQVAIDPEMLGRVFENLLASIVPETSKAASEKKIKGAFYTPREIVSFMCKESLKEHIKNSIENVKDFAGVDKLIEMSDSEFIEDKSTGTSMLWGNRSEDIKLKIIESLSDIKVLDPACGSGAFPIGFMQLMVKTLERLSTVYDAKIKKHRPARNNEKFDPHLAKLSILKNSLYGSDIEPMAIEISKLRAWLSLVIDEKNEIEPLPNLEFNFVCANSLIPLPKQYQTTIFDDNSYDQSLDKLIERYFESHSFKDKQKIREDFNYVYEELSRNDNLGERSKLLRTWNPFKFDKAADFFDSKTMLRVDKFDVVIGNPPYIPLQKINEPSKSAYEMLKDNKVYNTYDASGDIYALFYEMGTLSLKENGNLCYITSNKWMRSGYGESLRDFFVDNVQALLLVDLGSGVFESATVDTSILLVKKKIEKITTKAIKLNKDISKSIMSVYIKKNSIDVSFKKNEAWVILSKIDLAIIQKIEKNGKKLGEWPSIKINRGILTGLNDAFVINEEKRKEIIDNCLTEEEKKRTDLILRPLLRGKDINRYSYEWKGIYLIALVPSKHYRIEEFPSIEKHFIDALWSDEVPKGYGKLKLMQDGKEHNINGYIFKSRKPTSNKWFETQDQIAYLEDFNKQKVVYTAVNSEYRFCILEAGYYFNNSIFMISGGNDKALCFVLNSIVIRYYLYLTMGGDNYEYGSKEKFEKIPVPKTIDTISSEEDAASAYGITEAELTYIKDLMSEK